MRFTALQDPCGQWMVCDLGSGFPAQMPDVLLLGLPRGDAERLARQANEFLLAPRSEAQLSRYFNHLSIFYRFEPEQGGVIGNLGALKEGAPMRFAAMQDPCDDWLVCDLICDLPAEMAGRALIGLARSEAEQLADQANAGIVVLALKPPAPFASVA